MRTGPDVLRHNRTNPTGAAETPPRPPQSQVAVAPAVFNDAMVADVDASYAKIMARKAKRETEPRLMAQVIRQSYAASHCVTRLQEILSVLSEERGTRMGFGFSGPTGLVLTPEGFYVTGPTDAGESEALIVSPMPETLDVGPDGTCAMARAHLDSQLAQIASAPEEFAMPVIDKLTEDPRNKRPQHKKPKGLGRVPLLRKLFH